MRNKLFVGLACLAVAAANASAQNDVDLGPIDERHEMIPMRDGQRLSAYLYFPQGVGPWPAVFEQRYADIRGAGTRKAAAKLAEAGYVVALVNFRGTHLSQGTWSATAAWLGEFRTATTLANGWPGSRGAPAASARWAARKAAMPRTFWRLRSRRI
jgi:hypothetical protein